jgi:hypothetical protein
MRYVQQAEGLRPARQGRDMGEDGARARGRVVQGADEDEGPERGEEGVVEGEVGRTPARGRGLAGHGWRGGRSGGKVLVRGRVRLVVHGSEIVLSLGAVSDGVRRPRLMDWPVTILLWGLRAGGWGVCSGEAVVEGEGTWETTCGWVGWDGWMSWWLNSVLHVCVEKVSDSLLRLNLSHYSDYHLSEVEMAEAVLMQT